MSSDINKSKLIPVQRGKAGSETSHARRDALQRTFTQPLPLGLFFSTARLVAMAGYETAIIAINTQERTQVAAPYMLSGVGATKAGDFTIARREPGESLLRCPV